MNKPAFPALVLKEKEEKRFVWGHDWIFSNEIEGKTGNPLPGDVVELQTQNGEFLAVGFYNPASLISFRALSRKKIAIDKNFLKARIEKAVAYRKEVLGGIDAARLVFAESDGLPGLIVDRYGDYLSCEFNSLGMSKFRGEIIEIFNELLSPKGIMERADSSFRTLEGITDPGGIIAGSIADQIEILENGIKFVVDLKTGQKTGFFFDQRANRRILQNISSGKKILDCYTHTGAFALNALKGGAASALLVDSSGPALSMAKQNAELNGCGSKIIIQEGDAYQFLLTAKQKKEKFDIIILDPPALIKGKKNFEPGFKQYIKINQAALELLSEGGLLATSSCSGNMGLKDFQEMIKVSSGKAMKRVRYRCLSMQDVDHPVVASIPETQYLKFALLEVI